MEQTLQRFAGRRGREGGMKGSPEAREMGNFGDDDEYVKCVGRGWVPLKFPFRTEGLSAKVSRFFCPSTTVLHYLCPHQPSLMLKTKHFIFFISENFDENE